VNEREKFTQCDQRLGGVKNHPAANRALNSQDQISGDRKEAFARASQDRCRSIHTIERSHYETERVYGASSIAISAAEAAHHCIAIGTVETAPCFG
jgi:hypothetical protein